MIPHGELWPADAIITTRAGATASTRPAPPDHARIQRIRDLQAGLEKIIRCG